MNFQCGDLVRCADSAHSSRQLTTGLIYEVTNTNQFGVGLLGLDGSFSDNRFVLDEDAMKAHQQEQQMDAAKAQFEANVDALGGPFGADMAARIYAKPKPDAVDSVSGTTAGSILTEAAEIVQGARNDTHGDKRPGFKAIADLWNAYLNNRLPSTTLGVGIEPVDVAQMMVLLKMGRVIQGKPVRDHFVDQAGYSGCAGELAS